MENRSLSYNETLIFMKEDKWEEEQLKALEAKMSALEKGITGQVMSRTCTISQGGPCGTGDTCMEQIITCCSTVTNDDGTTEVICGEPSVRCRCH